MSINQDVFKIQLKLLDKYYSYNCRRSQEQIIRKASKIFTEKFLNYSCEYPTFEKIDLLAIVGFHFSLENLKKTKQQQDDSCMFNRIKLLNNLLNEHFKID